MQRDSSLSLPWVSSFLPKHHDPSFQPLPPSISRMPSMRYPANLLCPVRAYQIYWDRSQDWMDGFPLAIRRRHILWSKPDGPLTFPVKSLTDWFCSLILDYRSRDGLSTNIRVGPQQTRKLAASYSAMLGHDEQRVRKAMGFSSLSILRKNYVGGVPPLTMPCVLPSASHIPPSEHSLSDSD